MRYILLSIFAGVLFAAFNSQKCEHVFVSVEQAEVKVLQPQLSNTGVYNLMPTWPTGKQVGKTIVCVKCFQMQKQILDYEVDTIYFDFGNPYGDSVRTSVGWTGTKEFNYGCDLLYRAPRRAVSDTSRFASWPFIITDGSLEVPTKNAIRDKIERLRLDSNGALIINDSQKK